MNEIAILDNLKIVYSLQPGKFKRITMGYYHSPILIIKYPFNMPFVKIEEFINNNIEWIKTKKPKFAKVIHTFTTGEKYLFLGNEYEINLHPSKTPKIELLGNRLMIYSPTKKTEYLQKMVNSWRLNQAELVFQEILSKCFSEMEPHLEHFPTLEIKKYKSRWGCCFPKERKIIINVSVVNLPIDLIEYVVYHELSHFVYLNHSPEYHHFLQKYVPNERILKRYISCYDPLYA